MNEDAHENSVEPFGELVGSTLNAVTFLAWYLQLQFEGPRQGERHHMHIEVQPRVRVGDRWFEWGEAGYRDAICGQLLVVVRRAQTDVEGEQIIIEFETGALLTISLRAEDLDGMEAASYTHEIGSKRLGGELWTATWKDDWKRLYAAR